MQVGQEVDLSEYEPFREGNRLVVPEIEPTLKFTEHFPRLDGATAAYPVYAAMRQALYDVELNDDTRYPFIDNYLTCSNTSGGYDRLISGEADVFFGAQPSKGQQERAAAVGRELELTPIGHEAFVIFVNQDNPGFGARHCPATGHLHQEGDQLERVGGSGREDPGVPASGGLG